MKRGNYGTFWTSKLPIYLTSTSGNSLVVHRVSPGRIIVLSFWTKYVVHQIKLRILKFIIKRAQSTICTVILCLLGRKWLLSCRFGRTAKFWLPHTDCGCSCRMQGSIYREKKICPKDVHMQGGCCRMVRLHNNIWFISVDETLLKHYCSGNTIKDETKEVLLLESNKVCHGV